ncbi:MAG: hypothetical protein AAFR97_08260, partial [Bacteroidota bacterium]
LSGFVRANADYNETFDTTQAFEPFGYSLQASATVSIYGLSVPFSLTYRSNRFATGYRFPFNRYGLSPTFRWAKVHLGTRTMTFSPYTLAGRSFQGVGVELTPGKLRLSALRGRLENQLTQLRNDEDLPIALPAYERHILGVKAGIGSANTFFDLMVVKVEDRGDLDLEEAALDSLFVMPRPEENMVLGSEFGITLFKAFSIKGSVAASLHSGNTEARSLELSGEDNEPIAEYLESQFSPNLSTRWGYAGQLSAQFNWPKIGFGVEYRRVDPFFISLGVFFLQQDVQNIRGNLRLNMFKNKLLINLSGGVEENNLAGFRAVTNRRVIGSANINYSPHRDFSLGFNLSNFRRDNQAGFVEVNDSLRSVNLSQSQSLSSRWRLGKGDRRIDLRFNAAYQTVTDLSMSQVGPTEFKVLNLGLSPGIQWESAGLRIGPTFRYTNTEGTMIENRSMAAGLQMKKSLFGDSWSAQLRTTFRRLMTNEVTRNDWNWRGYIGGQLGRKVTLSLNLHYRQRQEARNLRSSLSITQRF